MWRLERKSKGGLKGVGVVWVVEDERVERNASLCMGIVGQGDGIPPEVESRGRGTEKDKRNSR